MTTCGYVCPQCEGRGFLDDFSECDYCKVNTKINNDLPQENNDKEDVQKT